MQRCSTFALRDPGPAELLVAKPASSIYHMRNLHRSMCGNSGHTGHEGLEDRRCPSRHDPIRHLLVPDRSVCIVVLPPALVARAQALPVFSWQE